MGRNHHTGLPNKLIPCPLGARITSDSCKKARCEYVFIPLRNKSQINNTGDDYIQTIWTKFVIIILILIFLKLVLFFCGGCCTFFLPY
jgi:hypothetical protein